FGDKRLPTPGRADDRNLPHTVEREAVSQVLKAERRLGAVADAHGAHTDQPFIRRHVRVHQARVVENQPSPQSLCAQGPVAVPRLAIGLCRVAATPTRRPSDLTRLHYARLVRNMSINSNSLLPTRSSLIAHRSLLIAHRSSLAPAQGGVGGG